LPRFALALPVQVLQARCMLESKSFLCRAICSRALSLLTVIAACSDPAAGDGVQSQLVGRTFLLQSSEGFTPVANTTVRVNFEQTQFGFYAGCNSHSGEYSVCGEELCVEDLGSTEIGCTPELHAQDQWLASFMTARPGLRLDGAGLILSGADATLEFLEREVADPDRALTGGVWNIDTFIAGGAASNFPLQVPPTLNFEADGNLGIFTTCNTGGGEYLQLGQELSLSGIAYTEEGCGASGSAAADAHIQQVLSDGTLALEIEANRLTLMRGELGLSATTD
jgi:heat shock protein HslJ